MGGTSVGVGTCSGACWFWREGRRRQLGQRPKGEAGTVPISANVDIQGLGLIPLTRKTAHVGLWPAALTQWRAS